MIILTPNRRLAAFSLRQFNHQQFAAQHECWQTPDIYPLEAWLGQIWDLCLDNNLPAYRPLISTKQQNILFEKIIQQGGDNELLRVSATAQNAIAAWKFLKQWQIDMSRLAAYADYSADSAAFYKWIQAYLLWLDQNQFYDFQLMVDQFIKLLPQIIHLLPKKVCLRGFNELTPQYATLVEKLAVCGVEITKDQLTGPGAKVTKNGCDDFTAELMFATHWAYDRLTENVNQTIGIVIPNLEQVRDCVHSYFNARFYTSEVNISAPLPLASYALIASALQILAIAHQELEYKDFSLLLRSPFVAGFLPECSSRAQLDRRLREQVEATTSWETILSLMAEECGAIKNYITKFLQQFSNLRGKHSAYYWAEQIQKLLLCWGWPGDALTAVGSEDGAWHQRDIEQQESDLLSCWQALLDEYCQLDMLMEKHTFGEALLTMRRLANETPFLPAETGITRIHVLGLLEAEGLSFDHLWVCGMSRDAWPPAANPNPFIPLELQRQFDLPHSSAARELLMAQKYTANLQQGGKQTVVFSYPNFVDDYAMAPSNLLAHIPQEEITWKTPETKPWEPPPVEQWQDNMAPAYNDTYVSGGAASLRLQAQCPFKANAEIRLKAQPLADPSIILTPIMRGSLVHEVLESFWRKCQSHAQLTLYTGAELESLLNKTIQDCMQVWRRERPFTLTNNYALLEAHRLYNLLTRWLDYEASRNAFVVYQLEEKTLISVGPLQINMKIDRIDQVDGHYVVIDYKTGITQMQKWFSDPIYEPQLPIYAVSVQQNVGAVAFASLRSAELKFTGVAVDEGLLPGVKAIDDWSNLLQDWQHKLQQTAADFVAGNAIVAPYSQEVCNTCDLHALCRIYEKSYE